MVSERNNKLRFRACSNIDLQGKGRQITTRHNTSGYIQECEWSEQRHCVPSLTFAVSLLLQWCFRMHNICATESACYAFTRNAYPSPPREDTLMCVLLQKQYIRTSPTLSSNHTIVDIPLQGHIPHAASCNLQHLLHGTVGSSCKHCI